MTGSGSWALSRHISAIPLQFPCVPATQDCLLGFYFVTLYLVLIKHQLILTDTQENDATSMKLSGSFHEELNCSLSCPCNTFTSLLSNIYYISQFDFYTFASGARRCSQSRDFTSLTNSSHAVRRLLSESVLNNREGIHTISKSIRINHPLLCKSD